MSKNCDCQQGLLTAEVARLRAELAIVERELMGVLEDKVRQEADEIARLRAENDALAQRALAATAWANQAGDKLSYERTVVREGAEEIARLRAEIARLLEALEKIASAETGWVEDEGLSSDVARAAIVRLRAELARERPITRRKAL